MDLCGTMLHKWLRLAAAGLIFISVMLSGISLIPGNDWARFERTSGIASIDYTLSADFDSLGFEYHIDTESTGGGGMIGGIGGGLGEGNNTIGDDWKTYPEVGGEVLENLGVLYDSYKLKSFQYELLLKDPPEEEGIIWDEPGSPSAILNVSLKADLVPYWPEGSQRPLVITVSYQGTEIDDQLSQEELDNITVVLEEIRLIARTGYDPTSGEYQGQDLELRVESTSESFRRAGDEYSITIEVEIPEGEDAVGFAVEIDASMTDPWGRSERAPLSGKANPINIRPVEDMNLVRGSGIVLAFPLILLGMILGIIGAVLIFLRKKPSIGLLIPAGILTAVGPLWFGSGMNAAVEMLSQRLSDAESGLQWAPGIYLAAAGGTIMVIAMILSIISFILRRFSEPVTGKGSKKSGDEPVFREITQENRDRPENDIGTKGQFRKVVPEPTENTSPPPPPPVDPFS